jgi:hypothetical protein
MSTSKFTNKSRNSKCQSEPIYANGRVIGQVRRDTFYKSIASNHYLRKPPAIAFSVESLNQAEKAGALHVEVKDRDTGTIYRATITNIREKGFSVNRAGFEPQIALSLEAWTKRTKGELIQPTIWGAV